MSPSSRATLLASLCLMVPTVARATQLPESIRPGACYDILIGPWRPPLDLRADSLEIAPPSRVRLDTTKAADFGREGFALSTPSSAIPSRHRFASWRITARDRISLSWSTGFSGLVMQLRVTPDDLQGKAETFWDFPRPIQRADVMAPRVECDAPPAASVTQRLLPRTVHVDGGDSVTLGQAWSGRAGAERLPDGTYRVGGRPTGVFRGATAVSVLVNQDGRISRIDLEYGPTDYAGLVAQLSRELGNPTVHDTLSIPNSKGLENKLAGWDNRTTSVFLWRYSLVAGGFSVLAMLIDPRL